MNNDNNAALVQRFIDDVLNGAHLHATDGCLVPGSPLAATVVHEQKLHEYGLLLEMSEMHAMVLSLIDIRYCMGVTDFS